MSGPGFDGTQYQGQPVSPQRSGNGRLDINTAEVNSIIAQATAHVDGVPNHLAHDAKSFRLLEEVLEQLKQINYSLTQYISR